jgi:hypothetical protein
VLQRATAGDMGKGGSAAALPAQRWHLWTTTAGKGGWNGNFMPARAVTGGGRPAWPIKARRVAA